MEQFTISPSPKKLPVSRCVLLSMKNAVLGETYSLNVAFVSGRLIRAMNRNYRNKDEVTDILSFPLERNIGEIVLCIPEIRRQAPQFGRDFKNFAAFLFIHGLLHLKGMRHGSTMERQERKFRKKFNV